MQAMSAALPLQTTSEKAIRKELQKHFKTDLSEKKALVKEHVSRIHALQGAPQPQAMPIRHHGTLSIGARSV